MKYKIKVEVNITDIMKSRGGRSTTIYKDKKKYTRKKKHKNKDFDFD